MKKFRNIFISSVFVQNVTKLLSANLIIQIIAFLLAMIITRLYSNDDFGLFAKFMSIAGVFVILSTARLEYAIILPKDDKEAYELISAGLISAFIFSIASSVILFFFSENINDYFKINVAQDWVFLMPGVVFFMSSFNLFINLKNRKKEYNKMIEGQAISGVLNPLSAIGFSSFSPLGLIQSIIVAHFFASIWLGFDFFKNKWFRFKINFKTILKKYYHFPTYNMFHALVNNVSSNLPVFMLSAVFENYLIGLFTMAIGKVFKPINLLGNTIYQVLSKEMVDDLHESKAVSKHFLKIISSLFFIGLIPFLILYFNASQIFAFVFGSQWELAGTYLKELMPWLFMVYLTASFTFIPNLLKQQKMAFVLEIFHFVLRFLALSFGIKSGSLKLSLSYYSSVGVFMLAVTLLWYYYLLKNKNKFNY